MQRLKTENGPIGTRRFAIGKFQRQPIALFAGMYVPILLGLLAYLHWRLAMMPSMPL